MLFEFRIFSPCRIVGRRELLIVQYHPFHLSLVLYAAYCLVQIIRNGKQLHKTVVSLCAHISHLHVAYLYATEPHCIVLVIAPISVTRVQSLMPCSYDKPFGRILVHDSHSRTGVL